jgi:hypothetical protein
MARRGEESGKALAYWTEANSIDSIYWLRNPKTLQVPYWPGLSRQPAD